MKLVVFAGAGFSVPYGFPTMDSFLGHADGSDRLTSDDKALLGTLVLEARRANSFLESSPTNLEDILTFSEMGDRLGLTPRDDNRNENLRQLVRKVFTAATPGEQFWKRYDLVQSLTGRKAHESVDNVAFITTNYDLNIECACVRAGWYTNPGFPIERLRDERYHTFAHLYQPTGVRVFKLHGSVNWYSAPEQAGGLLVEDRVVRMQGGDTLPLVCAVDYVVPSAPLLIPPSFLKPDMSSALKATWSGAARALSEASVLAFVGYSFPASDTEMMYFLARALSENAGLRRVLIIDPAAEEIVTRLRDRNSKTGSHLRSLIRAIPVKWEQLTSSIGALV